jgi:hypothetical protein
LLTLLYSCRSGSVLDRLSKYDLDDLIVLKPESYRFFFGSQKVSSDCFPNKISNICRSVSDYKTGEVFSGEAVAVKLRYNVPDSVNYSNQDEMDFLNLAASSYAKKRGWKYFSIFRNTRASSCSSYSTYNTDVQVIGDVGYGTTYENKNMVCSFIKTRYFFFFNSPKELKRGLFKLDVNRRAFYPFYDLYAEGPNLYRARSYELKRLEEIKGDDVKIISSVEEAAYKKYYPVDEMYDEIIRKHKLDKEGVFYKYEEPLLYKEEKSIEEKLMNTQ